MNALTIYYPTQTVTVLNPFPKSILMDAFAQRLPVQLKAGTKKLFLNSVEFEDGSGNSFNVRTSDNVWHYCRTV